MAMLNNHRVYLLLSQMFHGIYGIWIPTLTLPIWGASGYSYGHVSCHSPFESKSMHGWTVQGLGRPFDNRIKAPSVSAGSEWNPFLHSSVQGKTVDILWYSTFLDGKWWEDVTFLWTIPIHTFRQWLQGTISRSVSEARLGFSWFHPQGSQLRRWPSGRSLHQSPYGPSMGKGFRAMSNIHVG